MTETLPAVFLDRDGVLIEDVHLLARPEQVRLVPAAAAAVRALREGGFLVVVASNQSVVARGLASEADVARVHERVQELLRSAGGELATVSAFRFCPHHPHADVAAYRTECACRKPRPGMIIDACRELAIDAHSSYLVGDRLSDIAAGRAAGLTTILVESGRHLEATICCVDPIDAALRSDHVARDLRAAGDWILGRACTRCR